MTQTVIVFFPAFSPAAHGQFVLYRSCASDTKSGPVTERGKPPRFGAFHWQYPSHHHQRTQSRIGPCLSRYALQRQANISFNLTRLDAGIPRVARIGTKVGHCPRGSSRIRCSDPLLPYIGLKITLRCVFRGKLLSQRGPSAE